MSRAEGGCPAGGARCAPARRGGVGRRGAVVALVAAALLALVVPLAIGLAGAVAAPRALARRAREREAGGHRAIAAGEGEVREIEADGVRLSVRWRRFAEGVYAEVVPIEPGEGGAIVVEGASVEAVCARAKAIWERDARLRRARGGGGLELTGEERALLAEWLRRTEVF